MPNENDQKIQTSKPVVPQPSAPQSAISRKQAEEIFKKGMANLLDIIAPASFVVNPNFLRLGNFYIKTLFVYTYPRYLQTNWLSALINYDITADISMFIHPVLTKDVMNQLKRKVGQLESSQTIEREKGLVRNPELETAISDIEGLRDVLQKGEVRLFQYALYFTIYGQNVDELNSITKQLESTLGGMLVYTKQSFLQMEQGFNSSLPLCNDELNITRNLDTGSLSTTFPFTSSTLSTNEGILYGLNRHNNSLILFDRFSLENANSVVFGKSGSGKSYAVKLEALRYLMFGTDLIVIDPENEYRQLCESVGGSWMSMSLSSDKQINPFDLPPKKEGETGEDILREAIVNVKGLLGLMLSGISPEEDGLLDKALFETYALKDITSDPETHKNPPPLMKDLQNVLNNMTGAENIVKRLSKYTEGTFSGLFNRPTNFDLDKGFVVFSIRDLEEQLRPIGMYMVLNYVWSKIRYEMRKRIVIVDEAWILMQHEDSAKFIYGLAKRGRKYFMGLTVISQDVEDFLNNQYGKPLITNASLQLLLKQSTASIDKVAEVFNLTEGEKYLLLEGEQGEGLFFAGQNHVAIKVVASYIEDQLITTNPQQLLEQRKAKMQKE
ncbi:MAG: ATP-binding protein [Patescibacteria group bacterium]|nr:ATP-binding protein [Patescibacteria group bacterium]